MAQKTEAVKEALEVMREVMRMIEDNEFTKSKNSTFPNFPNMFGVWFRGQANEEWTLTPKVFRGQYSAEKYYLEETNLIHHVQRRMPEYHQTCRTVFDWLCHIQHYGVPTRLLDWSESILIALFHAVEDEDKYLSTKDGAVYVLNGRKLNSVSARFESFVGSVCIPDSIDVYARSALAVTRKKQEWERKTHEDTGRAGVASRKKTLNA